MIVPEVEMELLIPTNLQEVIDKPNDSPWGSAGTPVGRAPKGNPWRSWDAPKRNGPDSRYVEKPSFVARPPGSR